MSFYFFFFFQAEDGIRDLTVTGVQTCALPIWHALAHAKYSKSMRSWTIYRQHAHPSGCALRCCVDRPCRQRPQIVHGRIIIRSEEHTSELQSQSNLVCRLLLEKKKKTHTKAYHYSALLARPPTTRLGHPCPSLPLHVMNTSVGPAAVSLGSAFVARYPYIPRHL